MTWILAHPWLTFLLSLAALAVLDNALKYAFLIRAHK